MNIKSTFLIAALAALGANAAVANPLDSASLQIGHGKHSASAGDHDGTWVRGSTSIEVNRFDIGLSVTRGDIAGDSTSTVVSATPTTTLNNGLELGAFLDLADMNDGAGHKLESTHYGVSAAYPVGQLSLAGYAGVGEWDLPGNKLDTDVYGVSASYDLKSPFDIAAFYNVESSDLGDVEERGVALGYDLGIAGMRAITSITQVEDLNGKNDQVGFSLSVPLGDKAKADKGQRSPSARSPMVNATFMSPKA